MHASRKRRAAWRQSAENARLRHRKRKPLMAFTASTVKWMKLDRQGQVGRKGRRYIIPAGENERVCEDLKREKKWERDEGGWP